MGHPKVEVVNRSKAGKRLMSKSLLPNLAGLVSIGDPASKLPAGFRNATRRIRLEFSDVDPWDDDTVYVFPTDADIQRLIKFAENTRDLQGTIIVHCYAGLCRSPAAAFIMHCVWLGPGNEEEAMQKALKSCRETNPQPNSVMIEIADRLLEREDAMVNTNIDFFVTTKGMY